MSETADNARRTGPALEAMYQFLLWLVPAIDKFPRNQKFVLGDRIEAAALDRRHLYETAMTTHQPITLCAAPPAAAVTRHTPPAAA